MNTPKSSVARQSSPNPLLDFSGLPRFGEITPEHVAPAVDALLADARATIDRVAAAAATAFRGRPPHIDALLRHNGMSAS
jgi:oligopeptidase A